jgi:hypothetical protein
MDDVGKASMENGGFEL